MDLNHYAAKLGKNRDFRGISVTDGMSAIASELPCSIARLG